MKTNFKIFISAALMVGLTGCSEIQDNTEVTTTFNKETIVTTEEVTTVTEEKIVTTDETAIEVTESVAEVLTEDIEFYEDTDVEYKFLDEQTDYEICTDEFKAFIFEKYADRIKSIGDRCIDITGDGVADAIVDFSDKEHLEYAIVDGITLEVIPEKTMTFDYYWDTGLIEVYLVSADNVPSYLVVHRQSDLYAMDKKVYSQAKDTNGNVFGFYSPSVKTTMSLYKQADNLYYAYPCYTENQVKSGVLGKDYLDIFKNGIQMWNSEGNVIWSPYIQNGVNGKNRSEMEKIAEELDEEYLYMR